MSRFPLWLVCVFSGLMVPTPVQAEDKQYAEIERYAFTLLHFQRMVQLQDEGVQQALKLSKTQMQMFRKEGAAAKRMMAEMQTAPAAERETRVDKEFVPKAKAYQQLIDAELSDAQETQLFRQVVKHQRGAIAFILPGVPEHLQMTPKQWNAISKIVDDNRKAMRTESFSNSPLEIIKLSRRATVSRQAAENVLSAEQRSQWADLLR